MRDRSAAAFRTDVLAKLGFTVLATNYRKSPKHPFPCGLHDAIAAYLWLAISALDLPRPAAVALWSPWWSIVPRLLDSVLTNADKDFLSVLTNHKLGIIRKYAGEHVVRAGKPAMDDFLANSFVNQASAQPSSPALIQSSPSEQLATCFPDCYANQNLATARDLVQLGFQRLWMWWRDVRKGAVSFGKIQRMLHADRRVQVDDDCTGRAVQSFEE
ncbi:hypothetical protein AMAG_02633 [Allomyces macrogynus ATCC 38327]|uniref:Alpha/beta hydrolase fold-3 domain-containing protein n=1 Tax=Allomyces macrogynus (strain ATCC 38327) TaxID=578462 RepID=A0A0L0S367_ALLM3|nr:hypothetical protein AMAG_02633 [Allomyces macrogynus ATCC 38327]|eukprot:KNE56861.1 hypothetical protein AMAG_02633 [Allomyces macrogynus ATCC 38327]